MSLLRDALRFGYGSTNVWLYVLRRLLLLVPQLTRGHHHRLLPDPPAAGRSGVHDRGSLATKDVIASVRRQLGLDLPLWDQAYHLIGRVAHGASAGRGRRAAR